MSDRPNISFKDFSVAWEQRKIEGYASFLTGSGLSWDDISDDGEQECILYGNLYTDYGMITDKVVYKTNSKVNKPVYSKFGDVLIPASDTTPTGLARATSLEKSDVLLGGDINIIRPNENVNGSCLSLALNANKKELIRLIKGTTVRHIHNSEIKDIELFMPKSKEEQTKIAEFFKSLDNLITLHQRKYEEMNTLKKNMLQKMFPKKGKNVPEIRFEGFNEEWKRKKLGELYKERNEKGNESLDFLLVSIHTGVTSGDEDGENTGRNVKRSEDKSTYKHVYEGDLVFNMMRAWQGAIGVAKSEGMVSPAYISAIPNDKVYPLFMDYALRRDSVISDINNMSYGITDFRKRLYWDSFVNVECLIPSVEEQKKIYDFFNKIDMSLSLHQKRYKELTAIKKYMLQNMFV